MDISEKIEFTRRATLEMAEHTYPFIASVLGIDETSSNLHVGSAFRLEGDRRLAVTAAHVYSEAQARFGRFGVTGARGTEPYELTQKPIFVSEDLDVAIFGLGNDYLDSAIAFWPRDRLEVDDGKLSTDFLFLHGFPGVRSHFSALAGGVMNRSLPYGVMRREDELPPGILDSQFAVDFDPANFQGLDGKSAEWLDPAGLSGSAVWRIGASGATAEDWRPDMSALVGIVTHWKPDFKCLIATRWTAIASRAHAIV